MSSPRKALVFDLDGTLVDSLADIQRALCGTLEAHDRAPLTRAQVRSMLGDGAPVLVRRALAATGGPCCDDTQRAFLDAFLHRYQAGGVETTKPFPGAVETLERLRREGHRLGVCTNKPHRATLRLLEALGLTALFHGVVGGDALSVRKPNPEHFEATLRAMDARDAPSVMVGDTLPDAMVAQRAGVPFVLASYGYHRVPLDELPRDAVIDSVCELPRRLRELG